MSHQGTGTWLSTLLTTLQRKQCDITTVHERSLRLDSGVAGAKDYSPTCWLKQPHHSSSHKSHSNAHALARLRFWVIPSRLMKNLCKLYIVHFTSQKKKKKLLIVNKRMKVSILECSTDFLSQFIFLNYYFVYVSLMLAIIET